MPDPAEPALAHYRVDRESSGLMASKRKFKRIAEEAARYGDPAPERSRDIVRIYDREGNVVFERDWGENRSAALEQEATIVEDLLRLSLVSFRARYGIPLAGPAGGEALSPEGVDHGPGGSEGPSSGA